MLYGEFLMENIELQYCWMLHEIAKSLGMAENLQAILNLIVKSAVDNLGLKAASIRLLDKDKRTLKLEAAYGLSDEYLRKGPVEVDKSPN
jgi:signal transduction protein with GAF and PtsI domain